MKPQRHAEQVITQTDAIDDERRQELQALFPDVFTEGKLDYAKLRAAVGELADEAPERYTFSWAGRKNAVQLLQTPTSATLAPAPGESVNFDDTQNVFIEGDNLEVLKLLKKAYAGRVKMIYIDPPYNTGNDFIYPDNYTDPRDAYLQFIGQRDANGNDLTNKQDRSGRFHSAWLSMMYPRLFVARQLLAEDGVIFVSIDDNEVHNLRMLMNEVFGEENFVACVVWQKRTSPDARLALGSAHDYILVFARSLDVFKSSLNLLPLNEERLKEYKNPDNDPRGVWASRDLTGQTGHATPSQFYEITTPAGVKYSPPPGRCWTVSQRTFEKLVQDNRIWFGADGKARPRLKLFLSESRGKSSWTWWTNKEVGHNQEATKELNELLGTADVFDNPKPVRLIKRIVQLVTDAQENEIVLDFFSGSGTTAQAVLDLNQEDEGNRRFIMVQLPEPTEQPDFPTIADIGKERIRRVIKKLTGDGQDQKPLDDGAADLGFRVFKQTPSNFRAWAGAESTDPAAYVEQVALFTDSLADGWQPANVIAEVAVKEAGFGLNYRVQQVERVPDLTVYEVADPDREQRFYICLDDAVRLNALKPLELTQDDLFVCRDSALDDQTAANLALQCRLKSI